MILRIGILTGMEKSRVFIFICRSVDRLFLRNLMQHGLDDVLHIGKKFLRYEEHGNKVVAIFADGTRGG